MTTEDTEIKSSRNLAWWNLKNIQFDVFSKFFSIIGVIGAITAVSLTYLNYSSEIEENNRSQSVLDLHANIETSEISDTQSLVLINIDLTNKGKRSISPYAHTDDKNGKKTYSGEGLTLSVTRHSIPKTDSSIPEEAVDDLRIVERYNILEKKYNYGNGRKWDEIYTIKPNTTYRETEAIVLQRHSLYEIRVRFYAYRRDNNNTPETWTNTETKYLYVE